MGADEMSPNSYLSEFIQILSRDVVTSEAQQLSDPNIWRWLFLLLSQPKAINSTGGAINNSSDQQRQRSTNQQ